MSVADLLSDVLGDDVPVAFRAYDGVALRAVRRPHDDRRALARRAPPHRHRARRARVRPRLRRRRARGRRRHLRRDGRRQLHRGAPARPPPDRGGRQARGLDGPEAARRHRPRRRGCAAGATRVRATPPPSRTTTTSRTTSTGWCSGRRSPTRARCGTTTPPRWRTRRRTSTSSSAASSPSQPGMRLLDVGCGWGGMLLHAAEHHGVQAVGVTLSRPQAELARKRAAERGLGDRVEVRFADFRDVDDGPYDAISSIGMFEHVGLSELDALLPRCRALLRPAGPAAQPRDQPAAPRGQDAPPPVGAVDAWVAASPSATCSPTASCTRSATSCPRSSAPGSRPGTWRACASTTR